MFAKTTGAVVHQKKPAPCSRSKMPPIAVFGKTKKTSEMHLHVFDVTSGIALRVPKQVGLVLRTLLCIMSMGGILAFHKLI